MLLVTSADTLVLPVLPRELFLPFIGLYLFAARDKSTVLLANPATLGGVGRGEGEGERGFIANCGLQNCTCTTEEIPQFVNAKFYLRICDKNSGSRV